VPQSVLEAGNQRYLEGMEEVGGWLRLICLESCFIFTLLLLLHGPSIFPARDNLLLCFVTSWVRLLHFDITCLLEMSAFVVTLAEFVTAV